VLAFRARQELDPQVRLRFLQEATKIGMDDYALIPLHFQVNQWAHRANLKHQPRVNERTMAYDVSRVR
jgi:peptide/nickel transport system substrate-binding protein